MSTRTEPVSTRQTRVLLGVAAAMLLAVQIATAQGAIRDIGTVGLAQITQILNGGVVPAEDDAVTRGPSEGHDVPAPGAALPVSEPRASFHSGTAAGLTINAVFDSTITSDPNAAAIENTITTAIANIQSMFSDPITVTIKFTKMNSGLGQSSTYYSSLSYSTFLAALKADSKTSDDAAAIALLPSVSTNPVNGSLMINVKTANLRAVGITANPPTGQPDGSIGLNTSITSPGSPGTTGTYNLLPVVEHEIDEVLGLGSSLPAVPQGTIFPEDLYRYDQSGARTFTTTSGVKAFFSINSSADLAQFHNQNDGADFGDWESNPLPSGVLPKVQDAFATPGANPALSVELTALDVIGYDRAAVPPSISSQPSSKTITSGSMATMNVTASGTAPLSYQWYIGASGTTTNPIGGATGSSYTTPALTSTTSYWVRVSNRAGAADSTTATMTVVFPPTITTQPSNRRVTAGQNVRFTVAASGTPAPTYQWQISANGGLAWSNLLNTAPYNGVATTTLTVSGATVGLNGTQYRCVATNTVGSATSSAAMLMVTPAGRSIAPGDFDGDGKSDIVVFRPSTGIWYILQSGTTYTTSGQMAWGLSTDKPVPGDYDGDGKTDPAVFRPSTGVWYIVESSTNYTTSIAVPWGLSTDVPVPADYDGDGRVDPAVYRPSTGQWFILKSSTNYATSLVVSWGLSTDVPVQGDYDGDGQADPAVYRPSTGAWYFLKSSTIYTTSGAVSWGLSTDVPVPGDYDGDGMIDPAVYRPSTGQWYFLSSSASYTTSGTASWGLSTDTPVPGDYDGDGMTDPAVYRPSTGQWFMLKSSTSHTTSIAISWGLSTDLPVLKRP